MQYFPKPQLFGVACRLQNYISRSLPYDQASPASIVCEAVDEVPKERPLSNVLNPKNRAPSTVHRVDCLTHV